jgi:hypothetical protein
LVGLSLTNWQTNQTYKEGLYVTANRSGLTDVGIKVSTGGSVTGGTLASKIDGPGFEFSVVSAMGYIFSGN